MPTDLMADALGLLSGSLVGFSLGLVGGGGSILAVPLIIYVVGVPSVHIAIGTTALAVAVNAAANLVSHARMKTVKWRCAGVFAVAGMVGAFGGSSLSKIVNGQKLLVFFAILMMIVAAVMFARHSVEGKANVTLSRQNFPKLLGSGLLTGALSGFFGIGGSLCPPSCLPPECRSSMQSGHRWSRSPHLAQPRHSTTQDRDWSIGVSPSSSSPEASSADWPAAALAGCSENGEGLSTSSLQASSSWWRFTCSSAESWAEGRVGRCASEWIPGRLGGKFQVANIGS